MDSHIFNRKVNNWRMIAACLAGVLMGHVWDQRPSTVSQPQPVFVGVQYHHHEGSRTAVVCPEPNNCYPVVPFPAGEISPIPAKQVVHTLKRASAPKAEFLRP